MARLPRMLSGGILGALFGLTVGTGFAGVVLLLYLPHEFPMDRWYNGIRVFALAVSSSTVVGSVAGLASRASEHGLSLLKSTMIVAICGIAGVVAAIALARGVKTGMFLLAPLLGIIVGGIVVVAVGIARTNAVRRTKQEGENAARRA